MAWALCNPNALEPYKDNAKRRIKEYYSWDLMTDKYESLFVELTNNVF
jgi:hypothetical protein